MHLEVFAEGTSPMHIIDPRVKWITFIPFVFILAGGRGLLAPVVGIICALFLTILAQINLKIIFNRLLYVNIFVLLLFLLVPLSYPGETLWNFGPLSASLEGYIYVFVIAIKVNAIVLATISILGTSRIYSLAHALIHLKVPQKLIVLFFFFYRYISVLHEEFITLNNAAIIRSFTPKTNFHTYRTYAYMIGMLLVRSFERSQRVYQAMLCRGFIGNFPIAHHFVLKKNDVIFAVLFVLVILLMGFLV